MTEYGISMTGEGVRAILAGTKTQIRRIIPDGHVYEDISSETAEDFELRGWRGFTRGEALCAARVPFQIGDTLWAFMPLWASRLTLTVTDVRVQRLRDISEADAIAEGIVPVARDSRANGGGVRGWGLPGGSGLGFPTARDAYRDLWNSTHGPDAWDRNPWVAAITFAASPSQASDAMGGGHGL